MNMKRMAVFFILLLSAVVFSQKVNAQTVFPIAALGNCRDARECFYYCEIPRNQPACWSWGRYILHQKVLGEETTTPEEQAKKHGVTFPIVELGNCASVQECMSFCNKEENHDACQAFGKKKALIQGDTEQDRLLNDAKTMLDCDSKSTCSAFCQNPANRPKCQEFFQKEGLTQPHETARSKYPYVTQACTNPDSCRTFCQNPANKQQCDSYSGACMNFCKGNPDRCPYLSSTKQTTQTLPSTPAFQNNIPQISGCDNQGECYKYCQTHPGACPGFPSPQSSPSSGIKYPSIENLQNAFPHFSPLTTITPVTSNDQ